MPSTSDYYNIDLVNAHRLITNELANLILNAQSTHVYNTRHSATLRRRIEELTHEKNELIEELAAVRKNMTLEKNEIIQELLAVREDLDRAEQQNETLEEKIVSMEAVIQTLRTRQRHCHGCGMTGHDIRRCPNRY